MGKRTDGNKVHAGLGIGANIFKINSTRAFQRNAPFGLGTSIHSRLYIRHCDVVEQNSFASIRKRFLELGQVSTLDLNRLGATTDTMCSLESRFHVTRQRDIIVLD